MMGDGTIDAPAMTQANIALAMDTRTRRPKKRPTWWIWTAIHQLSNRRNRETTVDDARRAHDVLDRQRRDEMLCEIRALFYGTLPWLKAVDVMHLHSPTSAILSAVIFNALIIPALIPVALKGVNYPRLGSRCVVAQEPVIWGLGGVMVRLSE